MAHTEWLPGVTPSFPDQPWNETIPCPMSYLKPIMLQENLSATTLRQQKVAQLLTNNKTYEAT